MRLLADGVEVAGVIDAQVASNSHFSADRFRVRLAAREGVLEAVDAPGVRFSVEAGLNGDWARLVLGEADSVMFDPVRRVVEVSGRDLAALLVDSVVDEVFANRTAGEVATLLAGRHGLRAEVAATSTLVGRYYQSEHDRMTLGRSARVSSEWDLLAFLAGREGFDLFVEGDALRFGPRETSEAVVVRPADCVGVRLEHSLGMARQIEVTVRSWDQAGARAVVQVARGGGGAGGKAVGRVWKQGVVRPNLPAEEAQRLADRVVADLVRHERCVVLTMPGELGLSARSVVRLEGTDSDWDRAYAVSEVTRQVGVRHGFVQTVRLQGLSGGGGVS